MLPPPPPPPLALPSFRWEEKEERRRRALLGFDHPEREQFVSISRVKGLARRPTAVAETPSLTCELKSHPQNVVLQKVLGGY